MIIDAFSIVAWVLPILGYGIFLSLWWPHRSDRRISSLGWILAVVVLRWLLHFLKTIPTISFFIFAKQAGSPSHSEQILRTIEVPTAIGFSLLHGAYIFLIAWILSCSLAVILQNTVPKSPMLVILARQNRNQQIFGIGLIVVAVLPEAIILIRALCGHPLLYMK